MMKRGIIWDSLVPWIVAVVVLIVILLLFSLLSDRGNSAIDFFRDLLRFG